jgi:cytochrome P450
MAHAFSDAAIKEQEALIKQYVDKLYAHLRKDAAQHKPTDVLKWFNFTTFDIIGDLVFGEPFDCLDNSDYHPWVAMIFAGIRAGSQMVALLKLPLISWTLRFMISEADVQKRLQHKAMSRGKAERRIALGPAPNGRKDIMTYILRHNDERGMNHAEILGNSEALIAAGSETTATVLSGLVYYTGITPQALKRVQEEVRTAFSTEEEITMTSTAHLKYLHACIEEAMRLYPPAAETPPRVSPGGYVNGYYFPKGVSPALFLPHWSTNRNGLDLPSEIVQVEMIKD